jgi:hypothetical protein
MRAKSPPAQTHKISSTTHAAKIENSTTYATMVRDITLLYETYLSATTLEDLDEGRHGPSILEQRLEGNLGLADGVGIRMGEGGEELGQLGGRVG